MSAHRQQVRVLHNVQVYQLQSLDLVSKEHNPLSADLEMLLAISLCCVLTAALVAAQCLSKQKMEEM